MTATWEARKSPAAPITGAKRAGRFNDKKTLLTLIRESDRPIVIRLGRMNIPKGNGKLRPLGIPTLEDKLVQYAVAQILSAIYEADFLPCSYGYRPGRSPHDAVEQLTDTLYKGHYPFVYEADIKGYFDHIQHDWLVRMLEQRVNDGAMLRLVGKWLRASRIKQKATARTELSSKPMRATQQGAGTNLLGDHYAACRA